MKTTTPATKARTTAATVPLTIDHYLKAGKVKKGDLILSAVFGAGFTWGATIFRV